MPIIIDQLRAEAEAAAALHGVTGDFAKDAFTHIYTSSEMTRLFGEANARMAGDFAEQLRTWFHPLGNPKRERNMDLFNNSVGREIGKTSSSAADTANRAAQAVRDGTAVTDEFNDPRTAARVKLLVASFMRPTAEYRCSPNGPW